MEEKLGFVPHSGALNIKPSKDKIKLKGLLGKKPIEILPIEVIALENVLKRFRKGLKMRYCLATDHRAFEKHHRDYSTVKSAGKIKAVRCDIIEVRTES